MTQCTQSVNRAATVKSRPEARLERMTATGAEPLSLDASGTVVGTGRYRMRWSTGHGREN